VARRYENLRLHATLDHLSPIEWKLHYGLNRRNRESMAGKLNLRSTVDHPVINRIQRVITENAIQLQGQRPRVRIAGIA
jgi:hypothetical protein